MKEKKEKSNSFNKDEQSPYRISLPGFINDREIGLGDVIQRTTSYFGIQPCGGCNQRAAALNSLMVFTSRKQQR